MEIGPRIRDARKSLGLSQEALARRADISLNVINRMERGVITDPHSSTLTKLARALEIPVVKLIEEPVAPLGEARSAPGELVDMPEAEFSRVLFDATRAETLWDLYHKIDAERMQRELLWREDEANSQARDAYARSVRRRMLVLLSLPEARLVKTSDLERQAKELEKSVKIGHLDQ